MEGVFGAIEPETFVCPYALHDQVMYLRRNHEAPDASIGVLNQRCAQHVAIRAAPARRRQDAVQYALRPADHGRP